MDTTTGRIVTPKIVTAAQNHANAMHAVENWHLGPEKPSEKPGDNAAYWRELAAIWSISEEEARRQVCANCEYYDNTPEMFRAMDKIPFNDLDVKAGGRGYCHRLSFICHSLRSCMAWERRSYDEAE